MVNRHQNKQGGFTLMEMVVSMVVMGLLMVVMLPLLTLPANSYMDAQRRVELQQQLSLIRSKLNEDLKLAMPGSVRFLQVGNRYYLEYLEVRATARLRQQNGGAVFCPPTPPACRAQNALVGGVCQDDCATTIGPAQSAIAGVAPAANDWLAVPWRGNVALPNQPMPYTFPPNGTLSRLTAWTPRNLQNDVGFRFQANAFALKPLGWDTARMYVISQPVTYECNEGTGVLTKYWGYPITTLQQSPPVAPNTAVLSDAITRCPVSVVTQGMRQTIAWRLALSRVLAGQPTETVEALIQIGVREP